MSTRVPPLRGLTLGLTLTHRFTVGYGVPSLRDFKQDQSKTEAILNSSRRAKNLRISSTENTERSEENKF
jgi:hypothetical protein